ncbi:DUF960 family protein [Cohnella faecalis]|uniref:DUF960 domain-containing protein n=1 Tax=Cohnella faecalis TaxID=2315694 RepID=A0A398CFL3_9BACL|nr:DUF960 family protein [Cohnella faecalis]RIE01513.1 hypothetical protein D3H35_24475 [Cohnella faecalis]
MFPKHARYVTSRANDMIGPELQVILWSLIDRDLDEGQELDYLQVFTLSIVHDSDRIYQRIRQKQEQPKRKKLHEISGIIEPVSGVTVWIIDSGDYCTMLLPDDY